MTEVMRGRDESSIARPVVNSPFPYKNFSYADAACRIPEPGHDRIVTRLAKLMRFRDSGGGNDQAKLRR